MLDTALNPNLDPGNDRITLALLQDDKGMLGGSGAGTAGEVLADAARFYVYAYNTTTLVTTAGLALGIFFIVTAIALYAYYYSGLDTAKRSDRSWERGGAKEGKEEGREKR